MNRLSKIISLILVVVMLVTSCPMTAFSVDRTVASGGSTTKAGVASSINSPGIVTTKSVTYDAASGGYNLNIEAYVTGKTIDNVTGVPLDIAIVMDHSNSMPDCIKCNKASLGLTNVYSSSVNQSTAYYLENNEMAYYCATCKAWYTEVHSSTYNYHQGTRLVPKYDGEASEVIQFYTAAANENCSSACGHSKERHPIYESQLYNADGSAKTTHEVICNIPGDTGFKTIKYCSVCKSWYNGTTANQNEHNSGDHSSSNHCYPLRYATESAKVDIFKVTGSCNMGGTHVSKYVALYDAVLAFLASIEADAKGKDGVFGTSDDTHHRIAFVSFAGDSSGSDSATNAVMSCTPSSTYGITTNRAPYAQIDETGDTAYNYVYNNSFQDITTYDGRRIANVCLNKRMFSTGTQTTKGMRMAYNLFTVNSTSVSESASGKRSRYCVVFTDGEPTDTKANSIKLGAQIHDLGVPVYTVGTFTDAVTAVPVDAAAVKALVSTSQYMHLLSSNFPDATAFSTASEIGSVNPNVTVGQDAFFLSSTTTDGLKAVFQKIYSQIESPDVSLGTSTVLKDVVNSGFIVDTSRTTTAQVKNYSNNAVVRSITPSINGNTVTVTGFDYSANFVNTSTKSGQKMVLTIPIKPTSSASGVLPTNVQASSGIYSGSTLLETLPLPSLEVPASVTVKKDCLTQEVTVAGTAFNNGYSGGGSGGTLSMDVTDYSKSTDLASALSLKLETDTNLTVSGANSGVTVTVSGSTATKDGDNWVIPVKHNMVVTVTKHNIVKDDAVAATCTKTGLTEGQHCTGCTTQTVAQTVTAALGHDWGSWYVVTPATYFADGLEQRDCSRKDASEPRPITKLTDTSGPEVSATYGDAVVSTDETDYFNADVTVNVTAKDTESHIKDATYTVKELENNTSVDKSFADATPAESVSGSELLNKDGYYQVTVNATNTQDGTASTTTKTIVVDKTAPVITETAKVNYQSVTLKITDKHLTKVIVGETVYTADESGVIEITLIRNYGEGDKTFDILAKDIVGNETSYTVTIDKDVAPPTVVIAPDPATEYNDGPVKVTITAQDDDAIDYILYTVKKDGVVLENVKAEDVTSVIKTFEADGYYEITAISYDNEGNSSPEALESFTIDTVAPEIDLPTENLVADKENTYCNSPEGVAVTFTEVNPDVITITNTKGSTTTIYGTPTVVLRGSLEGETYTVTITDKAGHSVTETVTVYDQHPYGEWVTVVEATYTSTGLEKRTCTVCGHEETRVTEIIPDPTAPKLDVFIKDSQVTLKDGNTDYFTTKPVTVTVTATDEESLIENATYVVYNKDGDKVGEGVLKNSDDNKSATADVVLTDDGEYRIEVNATNTQGIPAEELISDKIVIDTSVPEVTITTTVDGVTTDLKDEKDDLFNTDVPVYVTVTDDGEIITPDKVTITDEKGNVVYESTSYDPTDPPVLTNDGKYTVTVEATDEAGNNVVVGSDVITVDKSVNAKVTPVDEDQPETKLDITSDRYIPIDELVNDTITNKDVTVIVEPDEDVVKTEYAYVKNGSYSPEQLEELTDWSDVPPVFTTDGEYVVYVKVTDEAGNEKIISTDIIEVDKTAPDVKEVTNVEYISKVINVTDLNLTEVKVDGKEVKPDINGNITLTRTDMNGPQTFTVEAVDAAGNPTVKEFTIADDAGLPLVDVVLDPAKDVTNTSVTATVTASDKETYIKEFTYTVTKDGEEYTNYTVISTTDNGVTLSFSEEGEYVVTGTAKDHDGNEATDSETIIIDLTDPELQLPEETYTDNGKLVYCGVESVEFSARDDREIVTVTVNGNAVTLTDGKYVLTGNGTTDTAEEYTVVVTDKAGNSTEQTVVVIYSQHNFVETDRKAATCIAQGYINYKCTRCNATKQEILEIDLTNHQNVVIDPEVNNSCEGSGKTEGSHCGDCGEVLVEQETVEPHGHNMGAWTQTKAPTCTEAGEERRDCTICDHYETRTVNALGHNYVSTVTDPTCTADGYTTHTCSRCDDTYTDTPESALGHNMGAWVQTKAPSCTKAGEERSDCSRCDYYETKPVNAHGHSEVIVAGVIATCTEPGKTYGSYCSICNEVLIEQQDVPALGHALGAAYKTNVHLDETRNASVNLNTYDLRSDCARCTYYESETLPIVVVNTKVYGEGLTDADKCQYVYSDLSEALADSVYNGSTHVSGYEADDTMQVVWLIDETDYVSAVCSITLDLNGWFVIMRNSCDLTNSHVVDYYGEVGYNVGRLIFEGESIILNTVNKEMPIFVEDGSEGYMFVEQLIMQQVEEPEMIGVGNLIFRFRPSLGSKELNYEHFRDGCADEHLEIGLRVIFKGVDGTELYQEFIYNDTGVNSVAVAYDTNQLFKVTLNGVDHYFKGYDVVLQSIVKSTTGVEYTGDPVKVPEPAISTTEEN